MDQIDEEMDIVVFEDEEGNEVELEVLFTFEHGDGVYALLQDIEPDEEEALNAIVPKYFHSLIYGALLEAVASENGARMQAMDSATSNADEMIDKLSLSYNRARQASITQELTEIIAGAEAIS